MVDKFRISIHAPVKGATPYANTNGRLTAISIHAPVKGATKINTLFGWHYKNFNPRTREGCDEIKAGIKFDASEFQSTHP